MTGFADPAPHLAVLLQGLGLARRTRIVDVGANPLLDAAPYAELLRCGACDVVGFEPMPEAFAALEKMASDRETYLPFAVGDGSRQELKVYRPIGFTSTFDPNPGAMAFLGGRKWDRVEARIGFDTVRLDDSPEVGPFDLLKIDIQGGECAVFRGAERAMAGAMAVIVELRYFRLYADEPMMGGVDEELRRQGFYLHKFMAPHSVALPNSQSGRLRKGLVQDQAIDGDAVYLRDMGRIADHGDDALKHLCVTAASVFGSHTLVLHCLDALVGRGAVTADLPAAYVDALPARLRKAEAVA